MLNRLATSMHYQEAPMGFPDNFSGHAFDLRWGRDETAADETLRELRDLQRRVAAIPRPSGRACDFSDTLNTLEDAFNDAIGEIERNAS